ncbi:MAG: hypothetical protein J5605_08615 [Bacteroidales bacterium]|jgi:hypothetical protein|nr:hypothetical protein [Bacteroidales bacterium]
MIVTDSVHESGSESSHGGSNTSSGTAAATRGSKYSIGAGEFDDLF